MTKKTSNINEIDQSMELAIECAKTAYDKKADDVVIMDLRGISMVADYFIVCTVKSRAQSKSLLSFFEKLMKEKGRTKLGIEGVGSDLWVLGDYGDIIIHIFTPDARNYYDLDMLWGDAPKLNWKED